MVDPPTILDAEVKLHERNREGKAASVQRSRNPAQTKASSRTPVAPMKPKLIRSRKILDPKTQQEVEVELIRVSERISPIRRETRTAVNGQTKTTEMISDELIVALQPGNTKADLITYLGTSLARADARVVRGRANSNRFVIKFKADSFEIVAQSLENQRSLVEKIQPNLIYRSL
jgi:hypothetical protein